MGKRAAMSELRSLPLRLLLMIWGWGGGGVSVGAPGWPWVVDVHGIRCTGLAREPVHISCYVKVELGDGG